MHIWWSTCNLDERALMLWFNGVYFLLSKASQARRAKLEKVTEERDKVSKIPLKFVFDFFAHMLAL